MTAPARVPDPRVPALRRASPRHARWARRGIACLALLSLAGCRNPFRPSEPEPPATSSNEIIVPTDYATPQGVLTTIQEALYAKAQGNGGAAYLGSFADTLSDAFGFTVVFDPDVVEDRLQAGKAIPEWTRPLEQTFYAYLCGAQVSPDPAAEYSLRWTPDADDDVDEGGGIAVLSQRYSLTAAVPGGAVLQIAYGHARITMRRVASGSRWALTRWEDTVDPAYGPDPTGVNSGFRSFSRLRIDSTGQ